MNKAGWSLLDHCIGEFLYVIIIKTRVREIDQSCQTWPAKDWHKISNLQYKINEDWHFFHWYHQAYIKFDEPCKTKIHLHQA